MTHHLYDAVAMSTDLGWSDRDAKAFAELVQLGTLGLAVLTFLAASAWMVQLNKPSRPFKAAGFADIALVQASFGPCVK